MNPTTIDSDNAPAQKRVGCCRNFRFTRVTNITQVNLLLKGDLVVPTPLFQMG